jgi:hypothetical protein
MKDKPRLIALEAEIDKLFQDYIASLPPGPRAAKLLFMKAFLDWKAKQSKRQAD